MKPSGGIINSGIKIWLNKIKPPLSNQQKKALDAYNSILLKMENTKVNDEDLATTIRLYEKSQFPRDSTLSKLLSSYNSHRDLFSQIQFNAKSRYDKVIENLYNRYNRIELENIKRDLRPYKNSSLPDKLIIIDQVIDEALGRANSLLSNKHTKNYEAVFNKENITKDVFGFSRGEAKQQLTDILLEALNKELKNSKSKYEINEVKRYSKEKLQDLGIASEELTSKIKYIANDAIEKRSIFQKLSDIVIPGEKNKKFEELQFSQPASFENLSLKKPNLQFQAPKTSERKPPQVIKSHVKDLQAKKAVRTQHMK